MAAELVDRMGNFVAFRLFLGMGAADSRALDYDNHILM
jgi:hypothetical protein